MSELIQAIAVLRVSTERQAKSGNGLSAQKKNIERFALENNLHIISWYSDEGISGSAPLEHREGLLKALTELKKGMVLLVHKIDRLSRDLMTTLMVEKMISQKGGRLLSASNEGTGSNNPADVLMRRMLSCFSEFEKNLISARTKAALQARKADGYRVGTVPFGFDVGEENKLVENASEQETLKFVASRRLIKETWRSIACELNEREMLNRAGRYWSTENLRKCCKDKF